MPSCPEQIHIGCSISSREHGQYWNRGRRQINLWKCFSRVSNAIPVLKRPYCERIIRSAVPRACTTVACRLRDDFPGVNILSEVDFAFFPVDPAYLVRGFVAEY